VQSPIFGCAYSDLVITGHYSDLLHGSTHVLMAMRSASRPPSIDDKGRVGYYTSGYLFQMPDDGSFTEQKMWDTFVQAAQNLKSGGMMSVALVTDYPVFVKRTEKAATVTKVQFALKLKPQTVMNSFHVKLGLGIAAQIPDGVRVMLEKLSNDGSNSMTKQQYDGLYSDGYTPTMTAATALTLRPASVQQDQSWQGYHLIIQYMTLSTGRNWDGSPKGTTLPFPPLTEVGFKLESLVRMFGDTKRVALLSGDGLRGPLYHVFIETKTAPTKASLKKFQHEFDRRAPRPLTWAPHTNARLVDKRGIMIEWPTDSNVIVPSNLLRYAPELCNSAELKQWMQTQAAVHIAGALADEHQGIVPQQSSTLLLEQVSNAVTATSSTALVPLSSTALVAQAQQAVRDEDGSMTTLITALAKLRNDGLSQDAEQVQSTNNQLVQLIAGETVRRAYLEEEYTNVQTANSNRLREQTLLHGHASALYDSLRGNYYEIVEADPELVEMRGELQRRVDKTKTELEGQFDAVTKEAGKLAGGIKDTERMLNERMEELICSKVNAGKQNPYDIKGRRVDPRPWQRLEEVALTLGYKVALEKLPVEQTEEEKEHDAAVRALMAAEDEMTDT
jgi:hypothetical protein